MNAPVSLHLDLYRYWTSKRGIRRMPSRSDIDPTDIPHLLPYVGMAEKVDGEYRYRLTGSDLVQNFEGEFTGKAIGSWRGAEPARLEATQAVIGLIFATGHPMFATVEHETKYGSQRTRSGLALPLSDDGRHVDKLIFTVLTRFRRSAIPTADWLRGAFRDIVWVHDVTDVETCCFNWERHCHPGLPEQSQTFSPTPGWSKA
jgi:hypothetical protein